MLLRGFMYQWFIMRCLMTQCKQLMLPHASWHWSGHIWLKVFNILLWRELTQKAEEKTSYCFFFPSYLMSTRDTLMSYKGFFFFFCLVRTWSIACVSQQTGMRMKHLPGWFSFFCQQGSVYNNNNFKGDVKLDRFL